MAGKSRPGDGAKKPGGAAEAKLRPDGRVATTLYIRPELLAEVQAISKSNYQPGFLFIERAVEKALEKARKEK